METVNTLVPTKTTTDGNVNDTRHNNNNGITHRHDSDRNQQCEDEVHYSDVEVTLRHNDGDNSKVDDDADDNDVIAGLNV